MMFYNKNIVQPRHTLSNIACMSGADLPGVDVVFLAAADPAAHAGHRLDQADQHGGGGGALCLHIQRGVNTEISPGDGAVTSRRWENNYLQQIFNYNTTHHHQATEDSKNFLVVLFLFLFSPPTTNTLNPHYFNVRTLSRRDPGPSVPEIRRKAKEVISGKMCHETAKNLISFRYKKVSV